MIDFRQDVNSFRDRNLRFVDESHTPKRIHSLHRVIPRPSFIELVYVRGFVKFYRISFRSLVAKIYFISILILIKKNESQEKRVSMTNRSKFFLSLSFPFLKFFAIFGQSRRSSTRWNDRNRAKKKKEKKKKRNGTILAGGDRVSIHHIHLHF